MADIVAITLVPSWSIREFGSASRFRSQIASKLSSLISNESILYTGSIMLLQGVAGGSEQAKIPFVRSNAPTGWTRDTSFLTDHVLRITDGLTVPPGASPITTGGSQGGSWIIGMASTSVTGDHTHTADHTHTMSNHSHTISSHYHGMSHTHSTVAHSHPIDNPTGMSVAYLPGTTTPVTPIGVEKTVAGAGTAKPDHTHGGYSQHTHGTNTGEATTTLGTSSNTETYSYSGSTGTPTPNTTGSSGGGVTFSGLHSHNVTHDGGWRPEYTNIIICGKD